MFADTLFVTFLMFANILFVYILMFGNILLSLLPNNNKSLKYGRTDQLSYYYFPA